jgi:hypothetical protein
MLEKAKIELERIELKNKSWDSQFMREHNIWEEIAMQINSHTGKKQNHWCMVMNLFNMKYKK